MNSSRLRLLVIILAALWLGAWIGASHAFRGRPAVANGTQWLLAGVLILAWLALRRRQELEGLELPVLCIGFGVFALSAWIDGRYWSFWLFLALCLWDARRWFGNTESATRKVRSVKAPHLEGTVEYDSMHFSGMRVEECAADWIQQLSQVKTDDNGRFVLPLHPEIPIHYLRFSWPGTAEVFLAVEIASEASPLLIRLKPRRARAF